MPALHLKPWTDQRLVAASAHTGRKPGITAGSYIDDLATLRKAILLCSSCVHKFNARRRDYVTDLDMPLVSGICDGCREQGYARHLFMHREQIPR